MQALITGRSLSEAITTATGDCFFSDAIGFAY